MTRPSCQNFKIPDIRAFLQLMKIPAIKAFLQIISGHKFRIHSAISHLNFKSCESVV